MKASSRMNGRSIRESVTLGRLALYAIGAKPQQYLACPPMPVHPYDWKVLDRETYLR